MVNSKTKLIMTLVFLMILSVLLLNKTACAANHYIRAGATGTADGSDWENAWTEFPKEWGTYIAAKRGDTYYYADGTYVGWQTRAAGIDSTAGATEYVTIKKATVADHGTETGWLDAYGDGQATFTSRIIINHSCFELDGQTGTGADTTSTYGFKIDLSPLSGTQTCFSVANGADSVFVRHFEMLTKGEDTIDYTSTVTASSGGSDNFYNLQFSNCYFHDVNVTFFTISGMKNSIIEHNYLQRRHTNSTIHGEGMSINGDVSNANNIIRYNIIKDVYGTGGIVVMNGDSDHYQIYNNIFFATNPDRYIFSNGAIGNTTKDTQTYMQVYNNTIYNCGGLNSGVYFSNGANNEVYNNLWYNCVKVGVTGATYGYNAYINTPFTYGFGGASTHDIISTADPFVNSAGYDFRLKSGSQAIDTGDSTDVTWTTDLAGNDRIQGANIDIGAFEYNTDPIPPSDLTNTVNLPKHSVHTFTDNSSDEEGFQITINGVVTDSLAANTETFSIDNQTPGTTYNVQIRAYKGDYLSGATVVNFTAPRYRLGRVR